MKEDHSTDGKSQKASSRVTTENHEPRTFTWKDDEDQYFRDFPGNITIGQRRKALRRQLIRTMSMSVLLNHDKFSGDMSWFEDCIGEAMVKAYALAMIHSDDRRLAKILSPSLCPAAPDNEDSVKADMSYNHKLEGPIERLHQIIRDCLPMCGAGGPYGDGPVIGKIKAYVDEEVAERETPMPA